MRHVPRYGAPRREEQDRRWLGRDDDEGWWDRERAPSEDRDLSDYQRGFRDGVLHATRERDRGVDRDRDRGMISRYPGQTPYDRAYGQGSGWRGDAQGYGGYGRDEDFGRGRPGYGARYRPGDEQGPPRRRR